MTDAPPVGLLATPQRQLPIAIVAEFFGGAALRQFGEALLPLLFVSIASSGRVTLVLLPVAALVMLALVTLRWWRTRFWVEHDELILEKGILNRTRLQVPLDRIQQIATEQGIIQQIFDVRKVSIDTAGSSGVEFSLTAISNEVVAELRQLVVGVDRNEPLPPLPRDLVPGLEPPPSAPPSPSVGVGPDARWAGASTAPAASAAVLPGSRPDVVLHMELSDLFQVGLVRPGGQVLSAVAALLGLGLGSAVDSFVESRITSAVAAASFIVGGLLLAAVALIGGAVLRDFELTVWRSRQGLRLTAGLLTKREQFARTERVQLVRRRSNPLERLLERTTIVLPQASAMSAASGSSSTPSTQNFMVPSVPDLGVDRLISLFLPPHTGELVGTISERARRRWAIFGAVWPALLFAVGAGLVLGLGGPGGLVVALGLTAAGLLGVGTVVAGMSQRRWRWQLDDRTLRTRHGVLVDERSDVELRKIQTVMVHRGWWQRRNGLASLECRTAGGNIAIPHLDDVVAESIRDAILRVVEQSEGPWM